MKQINIINQLNIINKINKQIKYILLQCKNNTKKIIYIEQTNKINK